MSFFTAFFYDRFMAKPEQACLKDWRKDLLKIAAGNVLEVGAGTGASIDFYPDSVSSLALLEPDKHMRKALIKNVSRRGYENISIMNGCAESIDANDETYDYVVASLVCCSVANLELSLREMRRVLKKGGSLLFLEHVAAEDGTSRRRWQNRINPLWKTLMANCHLNRETEREIVRIGFRIKEIRRESMRKAMPIVRPTIRGIAEKV